MFGADVEGTIVRAVNFLRPTLKKFAANLQQTRRNSQQICSRVERL